MAGRTDAEGEPRRPGDLTLSVGAASLGLAGLEGRGRALAPELGVPSQLGSATWLAGALEGPDEVCAPGVDPARVDGTALVTIGTALKGRVADKSLGTLAVRLVASHRALGVPAARPWGGGARVDALALRRAHLVCRAVVVGGALGLQATSYTRKKHDSLLLKSS